MARTILVTGGSRSGKSQYALALGEALGEPRVFIATCPVVDEEMRKRVARHQRARRRAGWRTIEEPMDPAGTLRRESDAGVVLVDCLTLWVNNLMYDAEQTGQTIEEQDVARLSHDVVDACRNHPGTAILVTNEVGMGIVPANVASRRFRDLAGRANQVVAAGADVVTLMVCGIPHPVKDT